MIVPQQDPLLVGRSHDDAKLDVEDRTRRCYVCSSDVKFFAQVDGHTYHKCLSCGNCQLANVGDQTELERFYDHYHLPASDGGTYAALDERMRSDFPDKVRMVQLLSGAPTNMRLLDVGCGKGYFVAEAAKIGYQAEGIDISASGVSFAKDNLNVIAHCANISDNTLPAEQFDIATFWATIEHLPYPFETLKSIYRVLRPGGLFFLDTGLADGDWFERRLLGTNQWFDPKEHCFVFSQRGLQTLLNNAGFSILSVDKNYERSFLRKHLRTTRNAVVSLASNVAGLALGAHGRQQMRVRTKWPIGKIISVACRRPPLNT